MSKIIPKGTKLHIRLDTGFAESDDRGNYITSKDYTEDELNSICQIMADESAQSYGIENGYYLDDEDLEYVDERGIQVSWSIEGYWEPYNEEEHKDYFYTNSDEFDEL